MIYKEKLKEDAESFRKRKQGKYGYQPLGGGGEPKTLVNVEYVSCSIMIVISTKE